jgi:SAM-dependent methyltransferase
MELLRDDALERSCIVANCEMNRERNLTGSNGYAKELGFEPLDQLIGKTAGKVRWLDLCCGSGKALIEAVHIVHDRGTDSKIEIVGVDLVAPASPSDPSLRCLCFVVGSLPTWQPAGQFDLITCVHGLHYIGDKLGLIARAASWLTKHGLLVANLDLTNIKLADGRPASRAVAKELRKNGLDYDSRKKLLRCPRHVVPQFPFRYLGADDEAGPNYTKQPAVDSYYDRLGERPTVRQ